MDVWKDPCEDLREAFDLEEHEYKQLNEFLIGFISEYNVNSIKLVDVTRTDLNEEQLADYQSISAYFLRRALGFSTLRSNT